MKQVVHLLAGSRGLGRRPDPVMSQVFSSGVKARPTIAYVGAASGDDADFRRFVTSAFKAAGAGRVIPVKLCGKRPHVAEARTALESVDLVFFSGGDVEEGMRVLNRLEWGPYLQRLADQGQRFFGISAGSIMLAKAWIQWPNPHDDASAQLFPCLGLAPVYCDTHGEAARWTELKALLARLPEGAEGFGIPSGSGLAVLPDAAIQAMGKPPAHYRRGPDRIEKLT